MALLRAIPPLALLAACGGSEMERLCEDRWGEVTCSGGVCEGGRLELDAAAAYRTWYAEALGLSDAEMERRFTVRRSTASSRAGGQMSVTVASLLEVDWFLLYESRQIVVDSDATRDQLLAAFRQNAGDFSAFDPDVELVPLAEVEAHVTACGEEHGVELPLDDLCHAYLGVREDRVGIHAWFEHELSRLDAVRASYELTGIEDPTCFLSEGTY